MVDTLNQTPPEGKVSRYSALRESFKELKAYLKSFRGDERPFKSAKWVAAFIVSAIFIDERILRFCGNGWFRTYFYSFTYVAKWEILSLASTLIITMIYWNSQMESKNEIDSGYFGVANSSIIASLILLIFAIACLLLAPMSQAFFYAHLVLVIFVAVAFLVNDLVTWQGMERNERRLKVEYSKISESLSAPHDPRNRDATRQRVQLNEIFANKKKEVSRLAVDKNEYRFSLFAIDIPMCVAFLSLGIYLFIHWVEHLCFAVCVNYFIQHQWHPYFLDVPANRHPVIGIWISKEYFIGGAIAFQFLVSVVAYISLSAGILFKRSDNEN